MAQRLPWTTMSPEEVKGLLNVHPDDWELFDDQLNFYLSEYFKQGASILRSQARDQSGLTKLSTTFLEESLLGERLNGRFKFGDPGQKSWEWPQDKLAMGYLTSFIIRRKFRDQADYEKRRRGNRASRTTTVRLAPPCQAAPPNQPADLSRISIASLCGP